MSNINKISPDGGTTEYNLEDYAGRIKIGPIQDTLVADRPYAVGDLFWYDDLVYKATAAIAYGDNIYLPGNVGANCMVTNMSEELQSKQNGLTEGTGIDITSNVISIDADSAPTSGSNKPVTSDGLYTKFNDYYTKTEMDAIDKPLVKYAGSTTLSELTTNYATYLDDDYENKFFLLTTGGTLDSTTVQYFTSSYSAGDIIPDDAHIAIINTGTEQNPVYKYDDFGGFTSVTLAREGTASASAVSEQKLNVNGVKYTVDGTAYMEQTKSTTAAGQALIFTFTNSIIGKTNARIDVYADGRFLMPQTLRSGNTFTVTYPKRTSLYNNVTCRIYIS